MLLSGEGVPQPSSSTGTRLKVFLDCSSTDCFEDYLREEVEIVDYVRDRNDAEVHVLVTSADTVARGREYTLSFIGLGRFTAVDRKLTVTVDASDSEDQVRRALQSALTVGLLAYIAPDAVPTGLTVEAALPSADPQAAVTEDPWRRWIFSIEGNGSLELEESTSEREWGASLSADRVTPLWKVSIGAHMNQSREEFNLEGEPPITAERRSRDLMWLVVRGLDEHWSLGARGHFQSSTFDNTESDILVSPAVEWNFFPYSMYTRRQLRFMYGLGVNWFNYYEETLYSKTEETLPRQSLSTTYEQREPWGTLEGRVEWSNYLPGLSTHRLSVEGEVDLRIARGLSLTFEGSASRIRDQLSLPRRDATPEEVLLRLRQLSSGFETRIELGITYQFGSRFAAIVNPRFGQ